eukprot:SAG31_NODE_12117_length_967_cov_0.862903_3_plen_82_part_01
MRRDAGSTDAIQLLPNTSCGKDFYFLGFELQNRMNKETLIEKVPPCREEDGEGCLLCTGPWSWMGAPPRPHPAPRRLRVVPI